jgi:phage/plasmid-associated DNA primase
VIEEGSYDLNTVYSKIKKTATSDKLSIEKKYADVVNAKNYINLIISTNSPCLITGDKGMAQRRLMNIKCSDRYLGNVEYFNRYKKAINNRGAVKAIYNMLMNRFKVKKLDPENTMYLQTTKPETKETNEVKEKSVPLTTQFLLDKLDMDIMSNGVDTRINRTTLYSKYKSWCECRTIRCCDSNSFYTNIADVDGLMPFKSNGIRFLIITISVKKRLLELNKDDEGVDELETMDEWI